MQQQLTLWWHEIGLSRQIHRLLVDLPVYGQRGSQHDLALKESMKHDIHVGLVK